MAAAPPPQIADVVDRLLHAKQRIVQAIVLARRATEAWTALNDFLLRDEFEDTPVHQAVSIIQRVTLDSRIMVIRLLDQPGWRGALGSDKISFPVCVELLALPGVVQAFEERASFLADNPDEQREMVRRHETALRDRLQAIVDERPKNRAERIRHFRDENIAHELLPLGRPRPEYRDLSWLLDELTEMTRDLALVVNAENIYFPPDEVTRSATALWQAVAAANPRE